MAWRSECLRSLALAAPALLFMGVLLLVPLATVIVQSFMTREGNVSPFGNYGYIFSADGFHYLRILGRSLAISLVATALVLLLAYPAAYFLAFGNSRKRALWLILLVIPFWISYLLRIFSWKMVLGFNGAINSGLLSLGLITAPVEALLYNPMAVTLTLAHSWSAFAVLPIYVSLQKIDRTLFEASADMGDTAWKRFRRITLPLSMPGVFAAFVMVFVPVMGDYITPQLVGGTSSVMIGTSIASLFGKEDNVPLGSAVSIVMMISIAASILSFIALAKVARLWRRGT